MLRPRFQGWIYAGSCKGLTDDCDHLRCSAFSSRYLVGQAVLEVKVMIEIAPTDTVFDAFRKAVERYSDRVFLVAPRSPQRDYDQEGRTVSFGEAASIVDGLSQAYAQAGYGHGHRVALLLDNRLEHVLHRIAMNQLGISCVPVNPEYRAGELAYLVDHSEAELIVALPQRQAQVEAGVAGAVRSPQVLWTDGTGAVDPPPSSTHPPRRDAVSEDTESSLLYTSGTTGRPKGCILSHGYEVGAGAWYASRGGAMALDPAGDRLYNPLPLYHVNAGLVSLFAMMLTGGAQVQPDRFHPSRWWQELVETEATMVHYLGVVAPMLLNQPPSNWERQHRVRLGVGAGIEPELHEPFETRFGFPLIELWGMTEMVRVLAANQEPRMRGTRAFGRPVPGLEVRVVDDQDQEVPRGEAGELLVRHSAQTPREGAFSGYLKDHEETERAWRGGWFHTGDVVRQSEDGMLHFVDRKKNIIRRSGENIAAAEVEALLQAHEEVAQVAVTAVADELRDEEVLACIVPMHDGGGRSDLTGLAERLSEHCLSTAAYYKAPGWVLFMDELPTTGTHKIQKHRLFSPGYDPRQRESIIDLRHLKRRR